MSFCLCVDISAHFVINFCFCYFKRNKSKIKYTSVVFSFRCHQNRTFFFAPKNVWPDKTRNKEWVMKFELPNEIWDTTTSYLNNKHIFKYADGYFQCFVRHLGCVWVRIWNGQQGQSNTAYCEIFLWHFDFFASSAYYVFICFFFFWSLLLKEMQLKRFQSCAANCS